MAHEVRLAFDIDPNDDCWFLCAEAFKPGFIFLALSSVETK
jgi:hypothetical protein